MEFNRPIKKDEQQKKKDYFFLKVTHTIVIRNYYNLISQKHLPPDFYCCEY